MCAINDNAYSIKGSSINDFTILGGGVNDFVKTALRLWTRDDGVVKKWSKIA